MFSFFIFSGCFCFAVVAEVFGFSMLKEIPHQTGKCCGNLFKRVTYAFYYDCPGNHPVVGYSAKLCQSKTTKTTMLDEDFVGFLFKIKS